MDVQTMKLEELWVDREGGRVGKKVKWLEEDIRWREKMRVLVVW